MSKASELYKGYINKYFYKPFESERVELMSNVIHSQKDEIKELEQQKAELIEFVKWLDNIGGMGFYVHGKIDELLKKYSE